MSADLIGDDACREAFNKARQQRFSVHGLDVVCEPDIFRAGYAAGRDSEIAKRDARMAEFEKELQAGATAVENCELFRAELAALKAQEPVAWPEGGSDAVEGAALGAFDSLGQPEHDLESWCAGYAEAVYAHAAPVSEVKAQGEYGDAYQGAREDLAIWKRRALEAEKALQEERIITERLGNALNEENGPTFMGEPVFPAKAKGVVMPGRANASHGSHDHQSGWNECLKEVARLNAAPVQQVSVPVACSCGREYPANSYSAGFISGSGMCEVCDAAMPPKDIPQQASVPDGWKLVPVELTPEMIDAAAEIDVEPFDNIDDELCAIYAAMLAAAQAAPAADAWLVDALEEIARSETAVGDIARSALAAHRAK